MTGGGRSLGRVVFLAMAGQGARVTMNYVLDTEAAEKTVREMCPVGLEGDQALRQKLLRLPAVPTVPGGS